MSLTSGSVDYNVEFSGEEVETELIRPISVFINHVDSYQGRAIVDALPIEDSATRNPAYRITGTTCASDSDDKEFITEHLSRVVSPKEKEFLSMVISNEIIVYDIGSDNTQIEEAQLVLRTLEKYINTIKDDKSKTGVLKYFILISTPLTWAKTELSDYGHGVITEEEYRKRRSHKCYAPHKCLEAETINLQKKCKAHVRTVVICPGFTYGEGEDVFFFIFKLAFCNRQDVPVFKPGNNKVPMLYIKDFGRIIKQIIGEFPKNTIRYILAVQPNNMTMLNFTRNVVFNVTGYINRIKLVEPEEVMMLHENLIPARVFYAVTMDLRMTPSYLKDFNFTFGKTPENIGLVLAEEYRKTRKLSPVRIVVDGPPLVGKTTLAKRLADYYQIYYIDTEKVIDIILKSLDVDINHAKTFLDMVEKEKQNGDHNNEDQRFTEDSLNLEYYMKKQLHEWEVEKDDILAFLESQHLTREEYVKCAIKCIRSIIASKPCQLNQGYVLDGFPFEYHNAAEIFQNGDNSTEELEEPVDESKPHLTLEPDFVILLDASDEFLCNRAMALPEDVAVALKATEDEMLPRLEKFRARNEEDKSLSSYFYDKDIIPITFCVTNETKCNEIFEKVKQDIGPPRAHAISKFEQEALMKEQEAIRIKAEMEERRLEEELEARVREEREEKLRQWTKKFEALKRKEQELLEIRSLPLQQYLSTYVLPVLTNALLQVVEVQPEDPVDFLAETLLENNSTGHVVDTSFEEETKKLLLCEGDEDTARKLAMSADNETDFAYNFSGSRKKVNNLELPTNSCDLPGFNTKREEVHSSNLAQSLIKEFRNKRKSTHDLKKK